MVGRGFDAGRLHRAPRKRAFSITDLAAGFVAVLAFAWWASSAEVLVGSARREGGTVLACRYVTALRMVERQYLDGQNGPHRSACALIRFG